MSEQVTNVTTLPVEETVRRLGKKKIIIAASALAGVAAVVFLKSKATDDSPSVEVKTTEPATVIVAPESK